MRKLLFIVLLLVSFQSFGQLIQYPSNYGIIYRRGGADTILQVPSDTFPVPAQLISKSHIAIKNGTLYRWNGSSWTGLSGGSTDTTSLSNRINLKLNISDTANKWITHFYRKTGSDSVFYVKGGNHTFAFKDSTGGSSVTLQSKGAILGNSTIATYSCGLGIENFLMTTADSALGTTITNLAVPGHTIAQQMAVWQADANKATYDWIIVEVGLNNLDYTVSAATSLADYQVLIDTINAQKKSTATVIVSAMTPDRQRLIDIWGSTNGNIAYQKWITMNNAIMGGQPYRITGVNYRVNEHIPYLSDTAGNLLEQFDCGDHVHENNAGRKIIAAAWRKKLASLGYLTTTNENSAPFLSGGTSGIGVFTNDDRLSSTTKLTWTGDVVKVTNSSTSGQPGLQAVNNASKRGGIAYNGNNVTVSSFWTNNLMTYAETGIVLHADAYTASGGTSTIKLVTNGYSNTTAALSADGSNDVTFGRKIFAPSLSTGVGNKAVRWNTSTGEFTLADTTTGGGGGVSSVSGTTNRITSTGGSTPVIDLGYHATLQIDTITLATFGGGGNQAGDTSTFSINTIYGSFYTPYVYFNDSLNVTAGATKLVNSPSALTNTSVGVSTTPDNKKIPPGNWVWVKTDTVTTKPIYFSLTLLGYKARKL